MNTPVLDGRSVEQLRQKVQELARSYTPEWRFEGSEDDPGAALAELFCSMFHQTVERMNRVPDKLFTEFLNLIGFDRTGPGARCRRDGVHGSRRGGRAGGDPGRHPDVHTG